MVYGLFRLIYSDKYLVDIGTHVFPTTKYQLLYQRLIKEGLFKRSDFIYPPPATNEEILLAHTKNYLEKLKKGTLSLDDLFRLELPYSKELIEASLICVKGTILACQHALEDGICVHIGGGFHHAFADHGEGFCIFNDIAVGIRNLQKNDEVEKIAIIDCDLHQGNGTADIFSNDKNVFTFSIHQENNYPAIKPPSDIDMGLSDGCRDKEYLGHLEENVTKIVADFKPELIVYVAGADPYEKDQLGGLLISMEGLKQRDKIVFGNAKKHNIPVAAVLAGGYAVNIEDTVQIHYNMIMEANAKKENRTSI
ncbi:MAG: histone deacetylase [Candidatus Omnitrophota bacterium]|nr:MAG: histone deacetylase [Candidatus Omnitrophota bacterium]